MAAVDEVGKEYNRCVDSGFILGIDIGTTSIKTALVSCNSKETMARQNLDHYAEIDLEIDGCFQRHEQDVEKIVTALNKCIARLPDDLLKDVKDIVVCGQMHGCILWNSKELFAFEGLSLKDRFKQAGMFVSRLVTWQDGRCSREFLSSLPKANPKYPLATGFGCATLFWLQRHTPEVLERYDCAGTIMDFVVACLSNSEKVYMSSHNACSWGYYDMDNKRWELERLQSTNFPTRLLPEVYKPGYIVGELSQVWFGIPSGAVVRVALGDMQCSIFATCANAMDSVLNIGTSTQLSVIVKGSMKDEILKEMSPHPALHVLPYFNDCCLVVAAALTGGNTLAFFVKMLRSWLKDLGLQEPCDEAIYDRLVECSYRDKDCAKLTISPILWGERHNLNQLASVTNISCESLSLGNVYNSLCQGLIMNIQSMMSNDFLAMCGVQKIIGTGSALVRNSTLQKSVQDAFDFQFVLCKDSNASTGAAFSIM